MKSFARILTNGLFYLYIHWKSVVIIMIPLIFLPLALNESKAAKCGFVICVMAMYWVTEAIPLPVTALIPIVLFPLFGILSSKEVCVTYLSDTNIMFMGGLIIAIAIEHCNLHKRIALRVLLMVGTSPERIMFGFMCTTMFLSMWISNSAATAMIVPIVTAVLNELKTIPLNVLDGTQGPDDSLQQDQKEAKSRSSDSAGPANVTEGAGRKKSATEIDIREPQTPNRDHIYYFMGVAYAANIGGTGTITGTATNLVFKGIFEGTFKDADGVNFATWMEFNVPIMLLNTLLAWLWLQILSSGMCKWVRKKSGRMTAEAVEAAKEQEMIVRELIKNNHQKLGRMSFHEYCVLFLFLTDVVFWFFRRPEFISGWGDLFPEKSVRDSVPAIAVVILLFMLPASLDFLVCGREAQRVSPPLLTWKVLQEKFPIGIILLLGGGFAIAKGCMVSGLSDYLGQKLEGLKELPLILILIVICFTTTFATEVSSNTAIANILLPVLAKMCRVLRIHPLYLMMPTTVCCSYAFMLPVATPPNAIVFNASNMRTTDMMKAGFGMNVICVSSLLISFVYIGVPMYGLTDFPAWAEGNDTYTS